MFRGKPEYNKKGKLNYKIDLVGVKSSEVFFYTSFHSNNLVESGINRAFGYILRLTNRDDKKSILLPPLKK